MRVYIPVTLTTLRTVVEARSVTPPGGVVFAVTDDLRAEYPEADDEELEYLAMSDAARACLRLLSAASADEPPLRVVISADVTFASVTSTGSRPTWTGRSDGSRSPPSTSTGPRPRRGPGSSAGGR